MKNLFEPATANDVKRRLAELKPDSQRLWGSMSPAQALAHCSSAMEWAVGDTRPPRMFLGRIMGAVVKPFLLGDEAPMRRNVPTIKTLIINDSRDLKTERDRLCTLIDRFGAGGPEKCTTSPHSFFGHLKADEWAALMYKHLDHHLRQFGV